MGSFIQNLRQFLGYVKLPLSLYAEFKALIAHFALLLTIFKKYEALLEYLGLNGPAKGQLKAVGWLLYLMAKNELFGRRREIVECACLLIPLVHYLVQHHPPTATFDKVTPPAELRGLLCGVFQLKSPDSLGPLFESLDSAVLPRIVRELAVADPAAIFSAGTLEQTVRKLHELVQRAADPDGLDEGLFLAGDSSLALSPAAVQSIVNVRVTPIKPRAGPSEGVRGGILTPGKCNISLSTNLQEAALAGFNIPYRASIFNTLTPVSEAFSMNNWLQERIEKAPKVARGELSPTVARILEPHKDAARRIADTIAALADRLADTVADSEKSPSSSRTDKGSLRTRPIPEAEKFRDLYICIAEELVLAEEKRGRSPSRLDVVVRSEEFHKSVFAAAAETILLVYNIEKVRFEDVLETCNLSPFDFWKLIPSLLRFDPALPEPILVHFQEIEKKILAYLGWQKESPVCGVITRLLRQGKAPAEKAGSEKENEAGKLAPDGEVQHAYEVFFKKVLELVARMIVDITAEMKVPNETIKEQAWEAMKYCLSVETEMLVERHIVHLVICSIYAVCKLEERRCNCTNDAYKFNSIIMSYIRTNGGAAPLMGNMFYQVKLGSDYVTAIDFYNKGFLPKMQDAIFRICSPGGSARLPAIIKLLSTNSPLHESLPAKYASMQTRARTSSEVPASLLSPVLSKSLMLTPRAGRLTPSSKLTPQLTPRTKGLIACTESPLFRPVQEQTLPSKFGPAATERKKKDFRGFLREKILEQSQQAPSNGMHPSPHKAIVGRKIVFDEEAKEPPPVQIQPGLRRPIAVPGLPKLIGSMFKGGPIDEKLPADVMNQPS